MRKLHFKKMRRWIRILMGKGKEEPLQWALQEGLKLGKNVRLIDIPKFGSEPYLIKIGANTLISFGVSFVTHDGSLNVLNNCNPDEHSNYFGPIILGENCFIGCNTTILANVHIGDNVIIGAGSVVNRDIPSNVVAAGVPCKVICTLDEYREKHKDEFTHISPKNAEEKKEILLNMFKDDLK